MKSSESLKFSNNVLFAPLIAVLCIWIVFWVEVKFGVNFNDYGIYPRRLSGLRGVVFSPFIHGSIEHLYNNTLPLAILIAFLFHFYTKVALKVILYGIIVSGFITWAIARPSYHIGASGLIYVLVSFIFFKGIFTKHYRFIAVSLVVVFIYGSMIWYIFPVKDNISWEGHLAGFLTGFFLSLGVRVPLPEVKKYAWEQEDYNEDEDPFLKHFDENGNFIESKEEELPSVEIKYHYKESKKE